MYEEFFVEEVVFCKRRVILSRTFDQFFTTVRQAISQAGSARTQLIFSELHNQEEQKRSWWLNVNQPYLSLLVSVFSVVRDVVLMWLFIFSVSYWAPDDCRHTG
ncbi:unnamed protein product [Laminaria digitata]